MVRDKEYISHLAAIVDSSRDAIISKSLDGIITNWNKGSEKMFGYTSKEMIGKNISLLIPPEFINKETNILKRLSNNEIIEPYGTFRIKKNGDQLHVSVTLSPLKDQTGKITGVSTIARDIISWKKSKTELINAYKELAFQNEEKHKWAEELLIANEELAILNTEQLAIFASIVNSSDDAILSKNLDGIITSWNHGAENIFGYCEDEIIGKHVSVLIPPHLQNEEIKILKKIGNGVTMDHYETERVKKDGTFFWASITISLIKDFKGNITGASKILRDISIRKQSEKKLTRLSQLYLFISQINQMIVRTKDKESLFKEACRMAIDFGGFKMAWIGIYDSKGEKITLVEQSGITAEEVQLHYNDPIDIKILYEKIFNTGADLVYNDLEHDLPFNSRKSFLIELGLKSCMFLPFKKKGKPIGSFNFYASELNYFDTDDIKLLHEVIGDISYAIDLFDYEEKRKDSEEKIATTLIEKNIILENLRKSEEKLEQQARDLIISNTELEQFAYIASHDLQEPLRMITSFLTQIEKKYGAIIDDKGKQYIDFAVDGAKRMRQIILDLLEFSRVGKTDDDIETIDLNELLTEIKILLRKKIEDKKAVIMIDQLPVIHNYQSPLRQIFQNLIDNALKYSNKEIPVQIHITVKELKDHWQFAVIDNGIGIENEYFDKIFIIFQRLHNKDEYPGTGMGLAIIKKIIEIQGGKIWVESEEEKGSSFYFTIKK